jgi:hypothetical protein
MNSVGGAPGRTAKVARLTFKIDLESIKPGAIGLKSNVQWLVD